MLSLVRLTLGLVGLLAAMPQLHGAHGYSQVNPQRPIDHATGTTIGNADCAVKSTERQLQQSTAPPAGPCSVLNAGWDYGAAAKNLDANPTPTTDPAECCGLCQTRPDCGGWAWQFGGKSCWLKPFQDNLPEGKIFVRYTDTVSGTRDGMVANPGICDDQRVSLKWADASTGSYLSMPMDYPESCCAACSADSKCARWSHVLGDFVPANGTCSLMSTPLSGSNALVAAPGYVSGTKQAAVVDPVSPPGPCALNAGWGWGGPGGDPSASYTSLITSFPSDCCTACQKDTKCGGWTWQFSTTTCSLFTRADETVRSWTFYRGVGLVSGNRAGQLAPSASACIVTVSLKWIDVAPSSKQVSVASPQDCCTACSSDSSCGRWAFQLQNAGNGTCVLLKPDAALAASSDGRTRDNAWVSGSPGTAGDIVPVSLPPSSSSNSTNSTTGGVDVVGPLEHSVSELPASPPNGDLVGSSANSTNSTNSSTSGASHNTAGRGATGTNSTGSASNSTSIGTTHVTTGGTTNGTAAGGGGGGGVSPPGTSRLPASPPGTPSVTPTGHPTTGVAQGASSLNGNQVSEVASGKKGLGTGALVGIVCAAVVGVILLLAAGFIIRARHMRRRDEVVVGSIKAAPPIEVLMPSAISSTLESPTEPLKPKLKPVTSVTSSDGLPILTGLRKGEVFLHAAARYYAWISSTALPQPTQALEAGINDIQLDMAVQQAGGAAHCPVIQLSGDELREQVILLSDAVLGRGAAALVFKCCWPSRFGPSTLLACKVLKEGSDADPVTMQSFAYEARVLSQARHMHVVRIYGYCLDPPTICIIMELLPSSLKNMLYPASDSRGFFAGARAGSGAATPSSQHHSSMTGTSGSSSTQAGSVQSGSSRGVAGPAEQHSASLKRANQSSVPDTVEANVSLQRIVDISTQVAQGLAYLHNMPEPTDTEEQATSREGRIVHRDLKPANLLINSQGVVKISDFGLAREHLNTTIATVNMGAGTLPYMAPELLLAAQTGALGVAPTNKVDIYSVAMLMYEMLVGQPPWTGLPHAAICNAVVNRRRPPLPEGITDEGREHSTLGPALPTNMPAMQHPLLPRLCNIIMACWHHRESRRPAAHALYGMLTALQQQLQEAQPQIDSLAGQQ